MCEIRDLITELVKVQSNIRSLDSLISGLSSEEDSFTVNPNYESAQKIAGFQDAVDDQYCKAREFVKSLCSVIDRMVDGNDIADESRLPDLGEAQADLSAFLRGDIRIHYRTRAVSNEEHIASLIPHRGDLVCAKCNGSFFLMIVLGYTDEICSVFDPTDQDSGMIVVKLRKSEWIPLPRSIPERANPDFEYPIGSSVLSLWHETGHMDWTTEFYPAKVIERPSELLEVGRVYSLSFGDGPDIFVPEQFVLSFPSEWRPS
jgi:hypothetical protein